MCARHSVDPSSKSSICSSVSDLLAAALVIAHLQQQRKKRHKTVRGKKTGLQEKMNATTRKNRIMTIMKRRIGTVRKKKTGLSIRKEKTDFVKGEEEGADEDAYSREYST